jgi:hypothetical protein
MKDELLGLLGREGREVNPAEAWVCQKLPQRRCEVPISGHFGREKRAGGDYDQQ